VGSGSVSADEAEVLIDRLKAMGFNGRSIKEWKRRIN